MAVPPDYLSRRVDPNRPNKQFGYAPSNLVNAEIGPNAEDQRRLNRDVNDTVISFPPLNSVGPGPLLYFDMVRGPILPARGTKERDRQLRLWDSHDFISNWQGARAGIVAKYASVEFKIIGPPEKVRYYEDLFGYAHFNRGFAYMQSMCLRDYMSQSYGAIYELQGPGDPTTPLMTAPTGINHLDPGRCYVTGNPYYPLVYYSLWDGRLHKMHWTRVYMMVDDPISDERYLGIGTCALERAIAVAQREMRMSQYIDAMLDDKPQPGILALTGVSDDNWQAKVVKYLAEQNADERPVFGRVMVLTSLDPNAKVDVQVHPFSQTPEKFDYIKFTDLDINELALAIGVDRQELWELGGRGLGSGGQSQVLNSKSRNKFAAKVLGGISRMINWAILPEDCEMEFVEHDQQQQQIQAAIDVQYSNVANVLLTNGFNKQVVAKLLANQSDSFKDAFTDDTGKLIVDSDVQAPVAPANTNVVSDSATPTAATNTDNKVVADSATPLANTAPTKPNLTSQLKKEFSTTSELFANNFATILDRFIRGNIDRAYAENLLIDAFLESGRSAYLDGLAEGEVFSSTLTEQEESQVQDWLADQIDYLDPMLDNAQAGIIPVDSAFQRGLMWARKSLAQMLAAGRLSADSNGMYEFYGIDGKDDCPTCKRLKGQVHRFQDWYDKNLIPGIDTENFECGGFQCQHKLRPTTLSERGEW